MREEDNSFYFILFILIVIGVIISIYNIGIDREVFDKPTNESFLYSLDYEDFNSTLVEQYILEYTNEERRELGLKPLIRDHQLDKLASFHSDNMAEENFISHVDHLGRDPMLRGKDLNIDNWEEGFGENVALLTWIDREGHCKYGDKNKEHAKCHVDNWMDSPGHRENILGDYTRIGIGASKSRGDVYTTQNFR